jgi:putative spermidine/putrescine transport system permease protein
MANTYSKVGEMTTNDGVPLKISLQRSQRKLKLWAFLLVAPLLLFIIVSFIIPVVNMSLRGVENPQVSNILPNVVEALKSWDGQSLPNEATFEAMVIDLTAARKNKNIGKVA